MARRETRDYHDFHAISRLAARQHGVVTTRQLREAGFSKDAIRHRSGAGQWHAVTRGVYAVGHTCLGPLGPLWVAHLATGAAVNRESAAWAWGLLRPHAAPIHVATTGGGRDRRGIRVHRVAALEVVEIGGLRVTSVAQTLADLPRRLLPRALREARYLRLLDPAAITAPHVRAAYDRIARTDAHVTLSEAEHAFLDALDAHDLPAPRVNRRRKALRLDFHWPAHGLIVEVDGMAAHLNPQAFVADRRRDRRHFTQGGDVTLRFAAVEVFDDPSAAAREVSAALARLRTLR